MSKDKSNGIGMSEKEFERQFKEARRRGDEEMATSPKAREVRFDPKSKRLIVHLQNGVTVLVPADLVQIFHGATIKEISAVEPVLDGLYLRWKQLDEDLSVRNLVSGIFGTSAWMRDLSDHLAEAGRKGGSSRSPAKRTASAVNGKKGGRPRKTA